MTPTPGDAPATLEVATKLSIAMFSRHAVAVPKGDWEAVTEDLEKAEEALKRPAWRREFGWILIASAIAAAVEAAQRLSWPLTALATFMGAVGSILIMNERSHDKDAKGLIANVRRTLGRLQRDHEQALPAVTGSTAEEKAPAPPKIILLRNPRDQV